MAVALIAMAAVLAGAALVLSASQQTGLALDVQSGRAYQAAKGGLEWGVNNVLRAGAPDCVDMAAPGTTFAYGGDLAGFHVTVVCSQTAHEDPAAVSVYQLTATGCNVLAGGRCDPTAPPAIATYAERQLRAVVSSN